MSLGPPQDGAECDNERVLEPKELVIFARGDHNNIMEVNREGYFDHLERLIPACG